MPRAFAPRSPRRRAVLAAGAVVAISAAAAALIALVAALVEPRSAVFSFLLVWVLMTWMGSVSRFVTPRLPPAWHTLRAAELDGRRYELLGVRLVKRLLRRGPLAVFNPGLHLPSDRTPQAVARLERCMRDAEASHVVVLALTLVAAVPAALHGWWEQVGWIVGFDVLVNGYPVMLQRYNRAFLARRFGPLTGDGARTGRVGAGRVGAGCTGTGSRGAASGGGAPPARRDRETEDR